MSKVMSRAPACDLASTSVMPRRSARSIFWGLIELGYGEAHEQAHRHGNDGARDVEASRVARTSVVVAVQSIASQVKKKMHIRVKRHREHAAGLCCLKGGPSTVSLRPSIQSDPRLRIVSIVLGDTAAIALAGSRATRGSR